VLIASLSIGLTYPSLVESSGTGRVVASYFYMLSMRSDNRLQTLQRA
jgi:hypothetical protein